MVDGGTLEHAYKYKWSDFTERGQRLHADNWVLLPDNLGERLSIDESCLQDDLFTILSNKAGHGRQGTVIAMVRGTKASEVIEVLAQMPLEERLKVKEVTMDLSESMRSIVEAVFPNAMITLDCFHILKRCLDAVEELRLRYECNLMLYDAHKLLEQRRSKRKEELSHLDILNDESVNVFKKEK